MDDLTRSMSSSANSSMTQSFSSLKVREPSVETISSIGCSLQDELFIDQKHPHTILSKIKVVQSKIELQIHFIHLSPQNFVSQGVLTDVTLVAGDVSIPCHRLLLSASSDYFAAMFTGGLAEQNMDTVQIQGVEGQALRQLVDYCYTGK